MSSRENLNKLLQLKSPITVKHKVSKVIISQPTLHMDNGKTALTNNYLCGLLEDLNIDII